MGLNVVFTQRKKLVCPKCGEIVGYTDVNEVHCGGKGWYPLLQSYGYYVPYEQRTEKNDWYGKDMILTVEQADEAYHFAKDNYLYNSDSVAMLVVAARYENDDIVVNADW